MALQKPEQRAAAAGKPAPGRDELVKRPIRPLGDGLTPAGYGHLLRGPTSAITLASGVTTFTPVKATGGTAAHAQRSAGQLDRRQRGLQRGAARASASASFKSGLWGSRAVAAASSSRSAAIFC